MSITLEQFVILLDESGIISAAEIAAFQELQSPPAESAEDLGKLLVKHKKVTKLQAQMVYQGKGDRLQLGNYVLLDKIGAGGMGDVYLAEHRRMERRVALKTLPAAMTRETQSIQRFQREVKAAAKLSHPNIVAAYDADEANGVHYFVMEYVEGVDLSAIVKKRGVLQVDDAIDYILQAAKGLEFAHNKGVIHRDIKPANMLLDNEGTIKILDMGLARIEEEAHEIPATQLTQDGSVMGTVDYMAPEQAKDTHTADARSDIYSLGCSLYYLLTGEPVYRGSTMVNRILAHQNDPIPSLSGRHILISQSVDAVFQKMVAKKPEDRFQSMREVIDAMENCVRIKTTSTVSSEQSDPELHKFLQSQRVAASPTVVMPADAITAEKPLTDSQHETLTSGFLNNTLGGTSFQPLPKRKTSIGKQGWIIAGAVLTALILLAGIILKEDTPAGTIILELDQPELAGAVVSVDDQQKITIKTGEGQEPIEVMADEKKHTLKVTKAGFETFTKQFTVKSGGNETIKVLLVPLAVVQKTPPSPKENYALDFSEKASVVVDGISYDGSHPITMELWFDPNENSTESIIEINSAKHVQLWMNRAHLWGGRIFDAKEVLNHGFDIAEEPYTKTSRVHFALTYDNEFLNLFLNGNPVGKTHIGNTLAHKYAKGTQFGLNQLFIGGHPNAKKNYNLNHMRVFECRISNVARYPRNKKFTPTRRFQSDEHTMALYHFDAGSGDVLKDHSGNGLDGKIIGARWVKVNDEVQEVKPATTSNPPMTDREIAEWVIGMGGEIGTRSKTYTKIEELPAGPIIIHSVTMKDASFKDHDLQRLAKLKTLRHLILKFSSITDTGLQYLSDLPGLVELSLDNTKITDKGLGYLKNLHELKTLSLSRTAITNSGMQVIGDLKQLISLNISYNLQIDDTALGYLEGLTKLEFLFGYKTRITDEGLKHLKGMRNLKNISMESNDITDVGLERIAGFEKLISLDLGNTRITDSGLEHLKNLKELIILWLRKDSITDVGLQNLHALKKLEYLDLQETKATPQGIADLQKALPNCKIISDHGTKPASAGDSPMTEREVAEWVIGKGGGIGIDGKNFFYSKVEELPTEPVKFAVIKLNNAGLEDDDLAPLANMRTLRALYLDFNPLHDTGLKYLKGLNQLETLSFSNSEITDKGLSHFKELPKLRDLTVTDSSITNSGMKAIGDLKQLDTLKIAFNSQIDDTGLGYIAGLTKLEKLYAHIIPRITDEGLKHLKGMKRLSVLTLATTGITDAGLEQLAGIENLSELDITNCKITDSGLEHLKDSKNLKKLGLKLTPVTDLGLPHLYGLKKLESLNLQETKVTPQGIADLQKALPNCKIISDPGTKPASTKAP